jgi:hypothetical protein
MGSGHPLLSDIHTGRCAVCGHGWPRRLDGKLTSHMTRGSSWPGSGQEPALT